MRLSKDRRLIYALTCFVHNCPNCHRPNQGPDHDLLTVSVDVAKDELMKLYENSDCTCDYCGTKSDFDFNDPQRTTVVPNMEDVSKLMSGVSQPQQPAQAVMPQQVVVKSDTSNVGFLIGCAGGCLVVVLILLLVFAGCGLGLVVV